MKNTVTLVGFVGNSPENRSTQSGTQITRLSLATNRPSRDGDGQVRKDNQGRRISETEWHRITCFNRVAQAVAEHIRKGAMLMVTGRIHYTRWTDGNGSERFGTEIIAERIDFLSRGKRQEELALA